MMVNSDEQEPFQNALSVLSNFYLSIVAKFPHLVAKSSIEFQMSISMICKNRLFLWMSLIYNW